MCGATPPSARASFLRLLELPSFTFRVGQISNGGPFCEGFSVLVDICKVGNASLGGCNDYNQMCAAGSAVKQCLTSPLPALPSLSQLNAQILAICNEMPMRGCEKCIASKKIIPCDAFQVYSNLCGDMPMMKQCGLWKAFCAATPKWPVCISN